MELSEGITRLLPEEHKRRGKEVTAHYREIFINTPEFVVDHFFSGVEGLMRNLKLPWFKIVCPQDVAALVCWEPSMALSYAIIAML